MLEYKLLLFFEDLLDYSLMVLTKLLDIVRILHADLIESWDAVAESLSFGGGPLCLVLDLLRISILPRSKQLALGFLVIWLLTQLLRT